jgi:protein-S-isoprenylcysteine O-methyltransferase Ste14
LRLLLKNLVFTVVVPGTVAVYAPLAIAGGRPSESALARSAAAVLLLAGAGIYAWCVWDFARHGRGTPAPFDAPRQLVARGLYRWSRNPMYLGVLCAILGQAALFAAPALLLYAACVGLAFHLFVVLYEEPHLREVFGPPYEAYRARVGRWLPHAVRRPKARGSEPPAQRSRAP